MDDLERAEWPEWWRWELEISPHVLERMPVRRFNEADLRLMIESATGIREDIVEGRWVVLTEHDGRAWEIIVEPDGGMELLIVVTAYPLET